MAQTSLKVSDKGLWGKMKVLVSTDQKQVALCKTPRQKVISTVVSSKKVSFYLGRPP